MNLEILIFMKLYTECGGAITMIYSEYFMCSWLKIFIYILKLNSTTNLKDVNSEKHIYNVCTYKGILKIKDLFFSFNVYFLRKTINKFKIL